jgi:alpha-beta hydrolase superfamily lysophospholipase
VRSLLFTLTVLGTLMPYAIHGLQTYESLTMVSPGAGLAIGAYPVLDRWIAALLLVIGLLAHVARVISRTRPLTASVIPLIMGIAYLFGFWPYALTHRGAGTSPTALPKSWLFWAMLTGVALTAACARRAWSPRFASVQD